MTIFTSEIYKKLEQISKSNRFCNGIKQNTKCGTPFSLPVICWKFLYSSKGTKVNLDYLDSYKSLSVVKVAISQFLTIDCLTNKRGPHEKDLLLYSLLNLS